MRYRSLLALLLTSIALSACSDRSFTAPGHDPSGPGNSEFAPGHRK